MLSQWVRRAASSTNFVPLLRPPDRKLIRVGSCINWLSVAALPLVAELPLAFLRPLLVLQLVMWAFGQFITNLPSNAIVMARVSGKDLSNVAAFTGMLSQVGMLLGYALLLAVSALGDQTQTSSFRPVWVIMIGAVTAVLLAAFSLPVDCAEVPEADEAESEDEREALISAGGDGGSDGKKGEEQGWRRP